MGATWHRAALISIHQEMSMGHIQESWSVSHQGEPCSWLRRRCHPPSSQVPEALPAEEGDCQDDSFLTETSRGRAPAQVHREGPWRSLGGSGKGSQGWQQIPETCGVSGKNPPAIKWSSGIWR